MKRRAALSPRLLLALVGSVAGLVLARPFLPRPLGGRLALVVVTGSSMAPSLRAGDLVLVRAEKTYRVGDVVAYRAASLKRVVIHRVVATGPEGRYIVGGDANGWLDSDLPSAREVLGRAWVRVPRVGAFLLALRRPAYLGLLAGLVAAWVTSGFLPRGGLGILFALGLFALPPAAHAGPSSVPGPRLADLLVATYTPSGRDKARAFAPPECDPVRAYLTRVVYAPLAATGSSELVLGSAGADNISAKAGRDCVVGGAGDDTLAGGPGDDVILGGPGTDTCSGGRGNDTFYDCEITLP